ncbi:RDD family protein [Rhodococcus oryzae]|uniref:RDD family protein n=1 Tax=Rhodococcus oryzae TaxID=2571143 RepID=UPI0037A2222C
MGYKADDFVAMDADMAFEAAGGAPGGFAMAVGVLAVAAGLAYRRMRFRWAAALAVGVSGLIGVIGSLWVLTNADGLYVDVNMLAEYSPGIGVIAALVLSAMLVGLSVTAMVFERQVAVALSHPVGTVPAHGSAFHLTPSAPATPGPLVKPRIEGTPVSVGYRLAAFAIDVMLLAVVVGLVGGVLVFLIDLYTEGAALVVGDVLGGTLLTVTPFAYLFIMESRFGKTVGKRIVGLAVVGPAGFTPNGEEAFRRNSAALLLVGAGVGASIADQDAGALSVLGQSVSAAGYLAALVAFVWICVSIRTGRDHVGIHDRFAGGTRVVHLSGSITVNRAPGTTAPPLAPWIVGAIAVVAAIGLIVALPAPATTERSASSTAQIPASSPAQRLVVPVQTSSPVPRAAQGPFAYPQLSPGACADPSYPGGSGVCTVSSPSGNFICSMSAESVICTSPPGEPLVHGAMVPLPGSPQRQVEANAISVDTAGSTSLFVITNGRAKATTREEARSNALPYEHRVGAYGFTCAVDTTAMHCRNDATGSGFTVSRQAYEFF